MVAKQHVNHMFINDPEESSLTPPLDRTSVEYQMWIAEAVGERAKLRRENARLWKMVNRLWVVAFVLFCALTLSLGYAFRHLVTPGVESTQE